MATTTVADPGLLRCPKNLRECIDWIVCIEIQDKTDKLAKAVETALATNDAIQWVKTLSNVLAHFIGYNGSRQFQSSGIGRKPSEDFTDLSASEIKKLEDLVENALKEAKGVKDSALSGLLGRLSTGLENNANGLQTQATALKKNVDELNIKRTVSSKISPACTALKFYLNILNTGYVLSYSSQNAKWPDCKSGTPCCGKDPCPECQSGQCPDGGCCDACPQKKSAKIFLGMLPCLYWGLRILWVRCKDTVAWPDWSQKKITEALQLKTFLQAGGYDIAKLNAKNASEISSLLDSLFNGSNGTFDNIHKDVSEKYFSKILPSSSCSDSCPPSPSIVPTPKSQSHVYLKTVRSILLWLSGLPFSKGFNALLSHCERLCLATKNSVNSDEFLYYIHTCCFLLPISVLTAIQCPEGSKSFFPSSSEWESFCYPSDPSALFDMFLDCVRKVFVALKFLYLQCKLYPAQGGWGNCSYGKNCKTDGETSPSVPSGSSSDCDCPNKDIYLCTASGNPVHDHCKEGQKCLGFGSVFTPCSGSNAHSKPGKTSTEPCKSPCPHPLQAFLCSGSSTPHDPRSPFKPPEGFPKMGFKDHLPETARSGFSLYYVLEAFCKDSSAPFLRLLKFLTCVSRRPPSSLLELYAFFKKFSESTFLKSNFVNWIKREPGSYSYDGLKNALERLYGSEDSHSKSHPNDLRSLFGCNASTCGGYLYALTEDASDLFCEHFVDTYLSWICYLAEEFKKNLRSSKELLHFVLTA
ncbi:variant erythrocyte surface antigen-1 family protein [Babesia divergens]|uniref:Variant erythrocyte surface antigen-1 family protein n=1 Tax=Babesia divergens TaxID=32595 RepID=A0AAD9GH28_BABDI|nr:variant erythrocyte surface antigen-1 family protein [Babesia divergens]